MGTWRKMTFPSSPAELPELGAAVLGSPGDVLAELQPGPGQHPRLAPHLLPLLVFSSLVNNLTQALSAHLLKSNYPMKLKNKYTTNLSQFNNVGSRHQLTDGFASPARFCIGKVFKRLLENYHQGYRM